ncbi:MAG: tripartite tricarboxylate transporter TctB family protein [Geminicoccaceae bacterium]|nr:tripartite tricarboxylate transporter TctB family protein [Geminicoccaceae bacterium]MCB9945810.1 tripartite tricarboxylate transporter TctB family protein [Geminicoccaceae bacterium]
MAGGRQNFLLGLGIAAFGVLLLLVIIPEGVVVPKGVRSAVLSPAFWPSVIAGFLIVSGLILAVQSRLYGQSMELEHHDVSWLRFGLGVVFLAVFYLLVRPIGLVLASMLAITAFGLVARARNRPMLLVTAVILPLLLYGFFVKIAGLPVPVGHWISFP